MKNYTINKGIGRSVEFKGLKAQYLFIFSGGLLGVLLLVMILYMANLNSYFCLIIGVLFSMLITYQTFRLNKKYGEYGLMKRSAKKKHPQFIICRKAVKCYVKFNLKRLAQ